MSGSWKHSLSWLQGTGKQLIATRSAKPNLALYSNWGQLIHTQILYLPGQHTLLSWGSTPLWGQQNQLKGAFSGENVSDGCQQLLLNAQIWKLVLTKSWPDETFDFLLFRKAKMFTHPVGQPFPNFTLVQGPKFTDWKTANLVKWMLNADRLKAAMIFREYQNYFLEYYSFVKRWIVHFF